MGEATAGGRWMLAEVLRRIGDLEAAERELPAALGMAVPLEHPGVLGTLSALRLARGRAEEAVARCTTVGGCGMFAVRSYALPTPRRSTRPARTTPRDAPSPRRGRAR